MKLKHRLSTTAAIRGGNLALAVAGIIIGGFSNRIAKLLVLLVSDIM
jgi:hypothetical protein